MLRGLWMRAVFAQPSLATALGVGVMTSTRLAVLVGTGTASTARLAASVGTHGREPPLASAVPTRGKAGRGSNGWTKCVRRGDILWRGLLLLLLAFAELSTLNTRSLTSERSCSCSATTGGPTATDWAGRICIE